MWICASAECLVGEHSRAALCVCCSQMLWKNAPNLAACFLQGIQFQGRLKSIDKAGMGQAIYAVMMAVYRRNARDVKGAFSGDACRCSITYGILLQYFGWRYDHIIDLWPLVQIITICALHAASLAITPQGDQKASRKNMDKNGTAKDWANQPPLISHRRFPTDEKAHPLVMGFDPASSHSHSRELLPTGITGCARPDGTTAHRDLRLIYITYFSARFPRHRGTSLSL